MLAASYEEEQKELKKQVQSYEETVAIQKQTNNDLDSFYALVDRYTSFEKLTTAMLNEFVDKVLVHKAEKIDGRRVQKVEIYLNFVGVVDFPEPEKTPEELEQEKVDEYWRDKYQRTKARESARRKKELAAENEIIDARLQEEREQMIRAFKDEVDAIGLEKMPVIPDRHSKGN